MTEKIETYKEYITDSMTWLGKQPDTVFLGEGIINAGRVYGTLNGVSIKKCIEMPIAENLIVGSAIGLAIMGYHPIVIFQRMDFMLVAADAIINHLCLIPKMSAGRVKLPVIIRAIIGNQSKDFDVGLQHKADYTHIFEPYIFTIPLIIPSHTPIYYKDMYTKDYPSLIIERFNRYKETS